MQKVRDASKKSEKYVAQLERDNFSVTSIDEHNQYKKSLAEGLSLAEQCIEKLMSDQGSAKISNIEVLLDKILGFQGQLSNVKEILSTIDVSERPGAGQQRFATMAQ